MRLDAHRGCVLRYLFGRRVPSTPILLYAVVDAVIPDVVRSVRSRRCPYCGREFGGRIPLRKHLMTGSHPCAWAFKADVDRVLKTYEELRGVVVEVGGGSGKRVKVRGLPLYFRNITELAEWVRRDGILLLSKP